ncbi:outer membrane beta-barrel protein [Xanthomonas cannabis]|uniref:outer membrane beta-barrel protein n=1 Tax=Xanthomonas cannabis TaxID=1885674 RepID=UPI00141A8C93|nr:outer membrane beta-barrel protein [Xanthomonas cannabis]NIK20533.1 hypothetical protein [Xanthomonas cannabis]
MKRTATLLLACTAFGVTAQASAQSLSRGWDSYRQQQKQQTGTQDASAPAAQSSRTSQAGISGAPAVVGGSGTGQSGGFTTVTEQTSAVDAPVAPAYAPPLRDEDQRLKSGVFLGMQSGRAEVFDGVKQDTLGGNVGYRWRAGAVTLIGIEAFAGHIERFSSDDAFAPSARFGGIGGNARFNFGDSPVFASVRLGYWGGESVGYDGDRFYGAYLGAGLGVDIGRHVSISGQYTRYLYANDYSEEDITINRADVLNAALEVRF